MTSTLIISPAAASKIALNSAHPIILPFQTNSVLFLYGALRGHEIVVRTLATGDFIRVIIHDLLIRCAVL